MPPHSIPATGRLFGLLTGVMIAASCTVAPALPGQPAGGQVGTSGKTLFAIYMIGSDLEDDVNPRNKVSDEVDKGGISTVGAGSDDLREIIEGYRSLSEAQKAKVDVFVACGGARKQGWKGVKVADIQTLIADSADNYFGNLPAYLYTDPNANMGDGKVFSDFVRLVKERANTQSADRTFVDLWDHGTAYLGMGPDKNPNGSMLRLPAITEGFRSQGFKADILGFDACLMANVEVAAAVRSAASLMVASEELEPGHGWDYTPIIRYMGQAIGSNADLAKTVVDSFLDSPLHRTTNGRTLSVIDLTKLDRLLQRLDDLAGSLFGNLEADYASLLTSVGSAQPFGKASKASVEYAVDLRHFSELLQKRDTSVAAAGQLAQAVTDAVLYARNDGTKPQSHGLSIFSLNNLNLYERKHYTDQVAATPAWYRLVSAFMNWGKVDDVPPTITAEKAVVQNGEAGTQLTVSDNTGIQSVQSVHALLNAYPSDFPNAGKRFLVVAQDELEANADGQSYFLPHWDGQAISLTAGGRTMPLPMEAVGVSADGNKVFVAAAKSAGFDIMVFIEWNSQTQQAVDYWVVPFTETEDGNIQLDKNQYLFEAGDEVAFYYPFVDVETDAESWELGPTLTLAGDPLFSRTKVVGQPFYFGVVSDLKGNLQVSEVREVDDTAKP